MSTNRTLYINNEKLPVSILVGTYVGTRAVWSRLLNHDIKLCYNGYRLEAKELSTIYGMNDPWQCRVSLKDYRNIFLDDVLRIATEAEVANLHRLTSQDEIICQRVTARTVRTHNSNK